MRIHLMLAALAATVAAVFVTTAQAADVPSSLGAVSIYADTVDTIVGDGLVSGDIPALRQATHNVSGHVEAVVAAEDSGPFVECAVELWAQMDEVKRSLDQLSTEAVGPDGFQAEVAGLRRLGARCLEIWNETH